MTRTYTLKRRAEQQAETRQRIVEAAVDLHGSVGPALTTFSMVAERAGVQRHTLYAHFPDERSLYLACSGLADGARSDARCQALARDRGSARAAARRACRDLRLVRAQRRACCLRAARRRVSRAHAARSSTLRIGPQMAAYQEVLGAKLSAKQRAMLAPGAQLLHLADAGARERPEAGRRGGGHGASHRWREGEVKRAALKD